MRFNEYGLLEPGNYPMTFAELRESILVKGEGDSLLPWDAYWRGRLVDNLEICVKQLWACGIEEVYIDGSFCTDKYQPNDVDGYFVVPDPRQVFDGSLVEKLNRLDPYKSWGWNRCRFDEYGNLQLEMWYRYRVELFPHCAGVYSGVMNEKGENMKFDELFRKDRDFDVPKGIVQLVKG
jgi:hypothetical protein